MGAAFNAGFLAIGTELAVMGLGIGTVMTVLLGLGMMLSIFERGFMAHIKTGMLLIIGGSALVGGAGVFMAFVVANFHL